jgi:outer membrane protein TolC
MAVAVLGAPAAGLIAQSNASSAVNPFFGSVPLRPASAETLKLSLDEAIQMGLRSNLGLKEAESRQLDLRGQKNAALQNFLPTLQVNGSVGLYQHDLTSMGYGPATLKKFAALMGSTLPSDFNFDPHDDMAQGQIQFNQILFSGPVIAGFRAAGAAERAAQFAVGSARHEVVQQVAQAYLHALASSAQVDNAQAQLVSDQEALRNAKAAHEAGIAANLDELRARVQLQAQQQALIGARNTYEKDLILLKREIGIETGQSVALTDQTPFAELDARPLEELRATAYRSRQDYQNLLNQVEVMHAVNIAYRSQRLPSLAFGGYYNVSDVTGVGANGNFVAQGNLSMPIFREAKLRGQIDSSRAQWEATRAQLASLRADIDHQLRAALLDTEASRKLVEVARSNVELATQELADEHERVAAGVDDNLPLVAAQATLARAQSSQVESLYQYNVAKLTLARATGLIETTYRDYLGK